MRSSLLILSSLLLAGCVARSGGTTPAPAPPPRQPQQTTQVPPSRPATPPPSSSAFVVPQIMSGPGLDGVIRTGADALVRQFGQPRLDVREADMRKLQFSSSACVLDVFLYPLQPGAEPVATWLETRRASDGAAVDTPACLQALRR